MKKILILDTSILCVWLQVPRMLTCGPDINRWDYGKVEQKIKAEIGLHTTFVLPLAVIIETGNHIAQANGDKTAVTTKFVSLIHKTIEEESPWAAFTQQGFLWEGEQMKELMNRWKDLVHTKHSLGDASIVDVAQFYAESGYEVEIFTGDEGLKAFEPIKHPLPKPRRRR